MFPYRLQVYCASMGLPTGCKFIVRPWVYQQVASLLCVHGSTNRLQVYCASMGLPTGCKFIVRPWVYQQVASLLCVHGSTKPR